MPMWDHDIINELKQRADIVSIIGNFVPLKSAGNNRWLGICPFHDDSKPSMNVTPTMGIYKCFACGAGGDVFRFLMEHEKMDFPMAVEFVAESSGFELPAKEGGPTDTQKGERSDIAKANEVAAEYFRASLAKSDTAKTYMDDRGFVKETVGLFQLGWAPDLWDGLLKFATPKGVSKAVLIRAGLLVEKDTGRAYDKFRGRVIFPIFSLSGQIVAFGGRVLQADQKPKYLNSPETPLYHKSDILYGLHQARQHISKSGEAIFVEGYMDSLQLYQAGICNVVAVSGTALTESHARTIARFAKKAYLIFDGDKAGRKAAERSLATLLRTGTEIRVLLLPAGEDPDSMVREHGSGPFLERIRSESLDLLHFFLESRSQDLRSPEVKARVADELRGLLSLIQNDVLREQYALKAAEMLSISATHFLRARHSAPQVSPPFQVSESIENSQALPIPLSPREARLAALVLSNPVLAPTVTASLDLHLLDNPDLAELIDHALQCLQKGEQLVSLHDKLSPAQQNILASLPDATHKKEETALLEYAQTLLDFETRRLESERLSTTSEGWSQLSRRIRKLKELKNKVSDKRIHPQEALRLCINPSND